jgi:hypothetical protein
MRSRGSTRKAISCRNCSLGAERERGRRRRPNGAGRAQWNDRRHGRWSCPEDGSDVEGWLRLIKAYSVLGERDKALAAAANARSALAGNSDNLRRIGELAKELGLEGS